ncbi:hypothetical protein TRFO_29351 [Tritrichomonas foetus]|uniref:DUF3447 domain-containing protein n=1 Tax=Tritrichomonas foetus TaxID=1144522 RepID=A0A1J4JWD7_9EUKA|nr:hypothetical protein TRFO_29351 [Tritrichomonas foetus]|eukprot:OHT03307.1 hypothetical protein TRFO_29351 [Tritrichomonas foetus]
MNFAANQNVAIVFFTETSLKLALTVDSSEIPAKITLAQFSPNNEKQHFTFSPLNKQDIEYEDYYIIESIAFPGNFLDLNNINFISQATNESKPLWQFINGILISNNEFLHINNEFSIEKSSNEKSEFHLFFYDGNSIPEDVPIIFYSMRYDKVITLGYNGDYNNGGHQLYLKKFHSSKPSQVWVFNHTQQKDIRSTREFEQVFDYYNDLDHCLLYTHTHHGNPNQRWDFVNYQFVTNFDGKTVEYLEDIKILKMIDKTNEEEYDDFDFFRKPSVFIPFLSNQSSLFEYVPDFDQFLYHSNPSSDTIKAAYFFSISNYFIDINKCVNDKFIITNDERIEVIDVEFSEATKVTFSIKQTKNMDNKAFVPQRIHYYHYQHECANYQSFFENELNLPIESDNPIRRIGRPGGFQIRGRFGPPFRGYLPFHGYAPQNRNEEINPKWNPKNSVKPGRYWNEETKHDYSMKDSSNLYEEILSGNPITITITNSEVYRKIGQKLNIRGIIEICDFVDNFQSQYDYLEELSTIQEELFLITPENIQELSYQFNEYIDKYGNYTIAWIILAVSKCKPFKNEILAQFSANLCRNIEFSDALKEVVEQDENSCSPNLIFYDFIHAKGIFSNQKIENSKNENDQNKSKQNQVDHSQLLMMIQNDCIQDFQEIFIREKFNVNMKVTVSPYKHCKMLNSNPTIIQYAAFFGSIKVFKFLLLQKADLKLKDKNNNSLFTYAICGGNSEIIHLCEQEGLHSKTTTAMLQSIVLSGNNSIYKWIRENMKHEEEKEIDWWKIIIQAIASKNIFPFLDSLHFLNQGDIIPIIITIIDRDYDFYKLLNTFSYLHKSLISKYVTLSTKVNNQQFEIEKGPILNMKCYKKLFIEQMISQDKLTDFLSLARHNPLKETYFILALKNIQNPPKKIIRYFLQNNFDFSHILIENQPVIHYLIKNHSCLLFDFIKTPYFDFNLQNEGENLLVYAITSKMFTFATLLMEKYSFNINTFTDVRILGNLDLKILQFLCDIPEYSINVRLSNGLTLVEHAIKQEKTDAIEILLRRNDLIFDANVVILLAIKKNALKIINNILNTENPLFDFESLLNSCIRYRSENIFISLIQSEMCKLSPSTIQQMCIEMASQKVYEKICHNVIPKIDGFSPLCIALNIYAVDDVILYILKNDSSEKNIILNNTNDTILTKSIKTNRIQVFKYLMEDAQTNINLPNLDNETPFYLAVKTGKMEYINPFFLRHDHVIHQKEMSLCIEKKLKDIVKLMIVNFERLNCTFSFDCLIKTIVQFRSNDYMPEIKSAPNGLFVNSLKILAKCIKYDFKEMFNMLIDENIVDMNQQDREGRNALCYSLFYNNSYYYNKLYKSVYTSNTPVTPFGNVKSANLAVKLLYSNENNMNPAFINGWNIEGNTALYTSIVESNYELFTFLLSLEGMDIYKKNKDGSNIFYALCLNKNWTLYIKSLLEPMKNAQHATNDPNYFGKFSPLHGAVQANNDELIDFLIQNSFETDRFTFGELIEHQNWKYFYQLMPEKLDFFMPLHLIEDETAIDHLIESNKIVFHSSNYITDANLGYDNFLIAAIKNQNGNLAQKILHKNMGIDVNYQDSHLNTAIHYAIQYSCYQIVYLLLTDEFDTNVLIENEKGESPVYYLMKNNNHELIEAFLQKKDGWINKIMADGETPLTFAVKNNDISIVNLFMKCNDIDLNMTNRNGQTALDLSLDNNQIFQFLIRNNHFNINSGIAFKVIEMNKSTLLSILLVQSNFNINQIRKVDTTDQTLLEVFMINFENFTDGVKLSFLNHESLNFNNIKIIESVISKDISKYIPYTQIFKNVDTDIMNSMINDESIPTFAAKKNNISAISALLVDQKVDILKKNLHDENSLEILDQNGRKDFAALISSLIKK